MSGQVERYMGKITIGLVEQNPLAIPYLEQLLRQSRMRVYSDKALLTSEDPGRRPISVFVVDVGTLNTPLHIFAQQLKNRHPNSKILLLGDKPANSHLALLMGLGVHGFVGYSEVRSRLTKAITAVIKQELWFPLEVVDQFASGVKPRESCWEFITRREQAIIGLLEKRLTNKEIASLLNVSENTVKFHLSNIFRKLEVHDRQSVIVAAISKRLRGELKTKTTHPGPLNLAAHGYSRPQKVRRRFA
jgi:DNA-binding NarL/FixJ family response regulator